MSTPIPDPDNLSFKTGSIQSQVFEVLKDKGWHCRACGYPPGLSGQFAGGGGIQGLERGTKSRPGLKFETVKRSCPRCDTSTLQDRWTGHYREAVTTRSIPLKVAHRIRVYFGRVDVVELRERPDSQLIIDHKFPMTRWGGPEKEVDFSGTDSEICSHFQLLKKDDSGNHNLLKSRACENCKKNSIRGSPLGIVFHYEGGNKWDPNIPTEGEGAEAGCTGCGWYDFAKWRAALNASLTSDREVKSLTAPPRVDHAADPQ